MTAPDFTKIFRRIPLLRSLDPQAFIITPLRGLTNFNFHLRYQHHDYVLRVPKKGSYQFIDRHREAFNEDQVIKKGLAPQVIWRDDSGLSLSHCIRRSRNLVKADCSHEHIVSLLMNSINTLHQPDILFKGQTDIIRLLKDYSRLSVLGESHITGERLNLACKIHRTIHDHDDRLVSSHNDLVLENLLIDDQQKLWLIDWEYSALSSPYWDIATLGNSARMDRAAMQKLLALYDGPNGRLHIEYLVGYQYLLQLLTLGWLAACAIDAAAEELEWLNRLEMIVTGLFDHQQPAPR